MKKIDYSEELLKIDDKTKIENIEIKDTLKVSFMQYAKAVNISRAIPDVRDGLKPVQRRIVYAMGEMGLTSDKPTRKCAKIVGEVLGKYHPHGDSSVYDALVRLAQDFTINEPLVFGQGNFGSVDGDSAAAYRYTEAKLSKVASEMLRDIDKDTVDFKDNFDAEEKEPVVLPSRFPNILVNGSDGIAVGMATNIPPHNLNEVIDGVIALIDDPEITIDDLMTYIPAPDYPTKGLIMGTTALRHAYKTGRGGIILRSRTEIEEYTNGKSRIIVTELPYQVNKARLIETIAGLVNDKRIEGISNLNDESDRNGMRIVIDIKKDYNPQVILNFLFKHTQLQVSNGIIFLAIVDGAPKICNLKEILHYYVEHQKEVIVRRTRYDKQRAEERAHILEGLVIALADIDEVIKLIKESSDKVEASIKLQENYGLTEIQAQAILDMRLQRLTGLEVQKIKEELESLKIAIADYIDILSHEERVLNIIKTELTEIKEKYGNPRKTEITLDYSDIDIADLIEKEDVVISLTHQGYIKRIPTNEYRSQNRGGRGVTGHKTKEEDYVENIFTSSTHDDVMFFTNLGRVYRIKAYEIPEAGKTAKGRAMINLLQLSSGERVTATIPVKGNKEVGTLIMATKQGLIKRTNVSEFESIRKVGKIAIKLNDNDELINVQYSEGNSDVLCASNHGKCIRFNENDVREMGRTAQGVKCMNLTSDDYIVDMIVLKEGYDILTISTLGYGKRSSQEDYRQQGRNGKGVYAGIFNEKTGNLVNLKQVKDDEDVILVTDHGTLIRIHADKISKIGRTTQGVRVMKLAGEEKIVSIATAEREEDEDLDGENLENNQNVENPEVETNLENTENLTQTDTNLSETTTQNNETQNNENEGE